MPSAMTVVLTGLTAMVANAADVGSAPAAPDSQLANACSAIYQRSCASCHEVHRVGESTWQEPDIHGELPAPPHDSAGHTWKHSDSMLYSVVQQGWRDPFNKTERLTMPAFNGQLTREETIAVINYLKTLWTPEQRRFQWEESRRHPFPPPAAP